MSGHSHHHSHAHTPKNLSLVFLFCIALNLLFVGVEAGVGFLTGSLGLLSDAGHNLSDVFSLVLALIALSLAKVKATERYTYGYKKSTILISLLNAVLLLVAVGGIVIESIHKFSSPAPIDGTAVSVTAGIGIVVNGLTAWLLLRQSQDDLNVRGAYLHMAADTLVSIGVFASGIVISKTGWNVIDPIISLIIALVILVSTWHLLSQSLRLTLDGVPNHIDRKEVIKTIESDERVQAVHHLHIWALSTTEVALTAHLVIGNIQDHATVKAGIKHLLKEKGIAHTTLEIETPDCQCPDAHCASECTADNHHAHTA